MGISTTTFNCGLRGKRDLFESDPFFLVFDAFSTIFSVDEGSYEPNPLLIKIRQMSEETLKVAHDMKIVKTQEEAAEEESDDELEPFPKV